MKFNAFQMAISLIILNASFASAQTPQKAPVEVETELKPFMVQTNYMSVPGYLRHQYYLETGERLPLKRFWFGYRGTRILCSPSTLKIDFGDQGQMGDVDTMNFLALGVVAHSIRTFPKLSKYSAEWSYFFSVGEGEYVSFYEYDVVYDRTGRTLKYEGGIQQNVTDADIFELNRKNRAQVQKQFGAK